MENKGKVVDVLNAHFKQWQGIAVRIMEQVSPLLAQQTSLLQSLQPKIEAGKICGNELELFLAEQASWKKKIAESIQIPQYILPDFSYLTRQIVDFKSSMQGIISPAFEQFNKSFHELPPRIKEALLLLGTHGWYMDEEWTIPDLYQLIKGLSSGNIVEAEHALIEHFESRTDDIEKSIVKRFPQREKIIRSAFNAHRREEYELSIPVILAQTDGICKELVNEFLFMKEDRKPCTAKYVERIVSDTFEAAFLSPLAQTLPIGASERERPEGFNGLNRHMVMHGESLDYGNKTNSLKAISLINYVAHELTS